MTLTDSVERCLRKGNFPESESPRRSEGCAACCAVSLVCRSGDRPPCHCPSAGGTACLGELRGRLGVGWGGVGASSDLTAVANGWEAGRTGVVVVPSHTRAGDGHCHVCDVGGRGWGCTCL